MKKSSYLLGTMALSLFSLAFVNGCGGEEPADDSPKGGSGTGGGGTGGGGAVKMTGVQLTGATSYTILSATDAVAGPNPAPAAYGSSACVSCHGSVGQGVGSVGPEIRHVSGPFLTHVVRTGRPGTAMLAVPATSLPDAQLTEIQTWLAGQPKPTTGQGLYLDYCGNCHGPAGGGGGVPVKAQGLPTMTITSTRNNVRRIRYLPTVPPSLSSARKGPPWRPPHCRRSQRSGLRIRPRSHLPRPPWHRSRPAPRTDRTSSSSRSAR